MSEKTFKFFMPIELTKAKEGSNEPDEWKIEGIASTDDEDLQGETIDQSGLDISVLKAGRGIFNNDHKDGPENVLGEIEDADFINKDGKRALWVKGYLFKHQARAEAYYNILKSLKKSSKNRVQMSIEGKILQRDMFNSKAIKKARITKIALTMDPVNPYTYADLCKSLKSEDATEIKQEETVTIKKSELEKIVDFANKALAAGAGYSGPPGSLTGGAAMTTESLEGKEHKVTYGKKVKRKKHMIQSIMKSLKEAYPNEDPFKLTEWVLNIFIDKLED